MFGLGMDFEAVGKSIVDGFAKMLELLTEIRDDTKAIRAHLEKDKSE